jgi:hypothetical protein
MVLHHLGNTLFIIDLVQLTGAFDKEVIAAVVNVSRINGVAVRDEEDS